ncbi:MAG: hypothetical protein GY874_18660 [Desulfobacteraceae bacterium]|nr:hypothetical protein [Desulfobacteraceae bacterium]
MKSLIQLQTQALNNEKGAALVVVVLVLVAITAIAMTLLNVTTMEMNMASNFKFDKQGFVSTDTGIFGGAKFIRLLVNPPDYENNGSVVEIDEQDQEKAGCISYVDPNAGEANEATADELKQQVFDRILGYTDGDAYYHNPADSSEAENDAMDINFDHCLINAAVNIYPINSGGESGGGLEFGAGSEGLGGGNIGGVSKKWRMVSSGGDDAGNGNQTIRAVYRYMPGIPGGL